MWYKIEVGNDGGILSCVEVEGSIASGKYIRYVEADSRTEAVKLVQAWWIRQAYYARRFEKGSRVRVKHGIFKGREGVIEVITAWQFYVAHVKLEGAQVVLRFGLDELEAVRVEPGRPGGAKVGA